MSRYDPDCIFCKIAAGHIPANLIYKNDHVAAFHDLNPVAPVHILIIPLEHISSLSELTDSDSEIAGQILLTARVVAEKMGVLGSGYRLVFNNGADALQSVGHIHAHLIGGKTMGWPPFAGREVAHGDG
ncbi:histidine triad (HIT) protein [Chlorobaculum parvum NCIB 8327]|uniref:Histidine triad (HIT) protein n=1 Tax=Chlorobaculum parvum (strain DSM 263 / NCIMB 8327) TaxID=517417 RepID=B3QLS3_CHLP8|nr:histidine triad nucleotide-binding protein [Chlorobaculum parvum]ACF12409.1 histidine triad (HIT) protein [Chlorobaculum parvum NCIB 8327]